MSKSRSKAFEEVLNREPKHMEDPKRRVSEYFGENTFHLDKMRECLTEEAYKVDYWRVDGRCALTVGNRHR